MMDYSIIDIEGIGEEYTAKLNAVGIQTTGDLLERAKMPKGREGLAMETGIAEKMILNWANHADLMRIKGVAGHFSELLEEAGVDTVKELRNRNAENLREALEAANDKRHLTDVVPSVDMLQDWIDQAGKLDPMLEY